MRASRAVVDDGHERLIRFLIARFGEDEASIRKLHVDEGVLSASVDTPARLRREVDSKREILGVAQRMLVLRDLPLEAPVRAAALEALQHLATVYDEHPAFEEAWRPRAKRRRG